MQINILLDSCCHIKCLKCFFTSFASKCPSFLLSFSVLPNGFLFQIFIESYDNFDTPVLRYPIGFNILVVNFLMK